MNPFPHDGTTWPPRYEQIFAWRQKQLLAMRAESKLLIGAKHYYKSHPVQFIEHWVSTYDPRHAYDPAKLSLMPFILFPRQKELVRFIQQCLAAQNNGLIEKARDMGATWLSAAVSVWLWLFLDGASIGWGSRKEQLVDKLGDPDSIFEKIRIIIEWLPSEFMPVGFRPKEHLLYMRVINPENGSTITGEAGDNIGRGGRKLIYFKDESAHYERPEKIEAALSANTRVQIDISSVNGVGNVFYRRRKAGEDWNPLVPMSRGKTAVFVMDWRDHPEKTQEWYDREKDIKVSEGLGHLWAQEVDRDYASSVTGVIIKPEWVRAAVDAHVKLGFEATGRNVGGLDVADDTPNGDKNALAIRKGPILLHASHWGGVDTGVTARHAVAGVRDHTPIELQYDCIGVGAGVKAETNRLVSEGIMPKGVVMVPWSAAAKTLKPKERMIKGDVKSPFNEDYFSGLKAQGWWQLARRFERTYRAVKGEITVEDPAELISLPSTLPNLRTIEEELCQATASNSSSTMKMVVDKSPDGTRSPNIADAIVMAYWPINSGAFMYTAETIG